MSSVTDVAELKCPKCNERTMHDTNWDAEEPDKLATWCQKCGHYENS